MSSEGQKRSDFFSEMRGCTLTMKNGWMRQAVKTDFRGGKDAPYLPNEKSPIVMILHGGGETNLCNLHHRRLAEEMASHLFKTQGWVTAIEPVAAVTDAISMGHSYENDPRIGAMGLSLFSREIFASSIVQQVEINRVDAVIIITGCDKTVAGGMLAASWLKDLPLVLVHGGTIRTGCSLAGKSIQIETAVEAAGRLAAGEITKDEYEDIILNALPSPGGCGVMATSNTLAVLASTLGISVFSSASTPAMDSNHVDVYAPKIEESRQAAEALVRMWNEHQTVGDIVDERSFSNVATMLHAIGGSTNAVIHLPAIAEGFGIPFGLEEIRAKSDTPVLLNLLPAGKFVMVDLYEKAGGLLPLTHYMIGKGLLDPEAKTITGKTIGADVSDAPFPEFQDPDTDVIRSVESPLKAKSSLVIVKGDHSNETTASIATRGCVFKVNAQQRILEGPARVFDIENDAVKEVLSGGINDGDIIVLRYQGVSVGCPELLRLTAALTGMGNDSRIAVVTDGRLSGVSRGTLVVHVEPEAWKGGPIALINEGDIVRLDGDTEELFVRVRAEEMAQRKSAWKRPELTLPRGTMRIASQIVRPLEEGALWWPRD
jgi:dihydroxy-acid dehydratase